MKTLNYLKDLRDIDSTNISSKSNIGNSSELSPRKRKARGMFIDDNISKDITVLPPSIEPQQVYSILMILSD